MKELDLPINNIAEITLIGTGGGYGESLVIHLGNQNWIVIDSCINPETKKSLPLEYLQSIGVDISNNVKLILCTHWHDDHLKGISQLLEQAETAKFCFARANDRVKFLQFVSLDYQKLSREVSNSSTVEFNKCLEIISYRDKNNQIKLAQENTTLISLKINDSIQSEVFSLSPSDFTILEFDKEISTLITEYGVTNKKVLKKTPNSKCIVVYLKLGNHRAILGADLEVTEDNRDGWLNILDMSEVIDIKASLFKIPHHGSKTGYHERIWLELLEPNSVAKLTPWNLSTKLPEISMLEKYCAHSDKVYMTSDKFNEKPKSRNKRIEKMITKLKCKVFEVKYKQGIIRCRIDLNDNTSQWSTSLFENAFHVNNQIN